MLRFESSSVTCKHKLRLSAHKLRQVCKSDRLVYIKQYKLFTKYAVNIEFEVDYDEVCTFIKKEGSLAKKSIAFNNKLKVYFLFEHMQVRSLSLHLVFPAS